MISTCSEEGRRGPPKCVVLSGVVGPSGPTSLSWTVGFTVDLRPRRWGRFGVQVGRCRFTGTSVLSPALSVSLGPNLGRVTDVTDRSGDTRVTPWALSVCGTNTTPYHSQIGHCHSQIETLWSGFHPGLCLSKRLTSSQKRKSFRVSG